MTITITIANQKGGVGKTTTAVNLAHGAALKGRSVLLVDLDTQGNVADALGLEPENDLIKALLGVGYFDRYAIQARENLWAIRSDKRTASLKLMLGAMDFREQALSRLTRGLEYDLVLFDCAPSVDILHTAALVASDFLIIPTKPDQLAVKGVAELLGSLAAINQASNCGCRLAGIIPTFYDHSTRESLLQLTNLAKAFSPYIWPTVPLDTRCREANRLGKTLWELQPTPRALGSKSTADGGYSKDLERLMVML